MDPELITPEFIANLEILIFVATLVFVIVGLLAFRLLLAWPYAKNSPGSPVEVKVKAEPKDNSYTLWAAEAEAKGLTEAANINAKAAADNRAAAVARLELARIEHGVQEASGDR